MINTRRSRRTRTALRQCWISVADCCKPLFSPREGQTGSVHTSYAILHAFFIGCRVRDGWQDAASLYQLDLNHSIMILAALSQGQTIAGSRLDIGEMFHLIKAMIIDLPESANSAQIERLFADVKTLPFWINTYDSDGFHDLLDRGRCASFLGLMTSLESLTFSTGHATNTPFMFPDFSQIFGDITWPHLRRLELAGFCATTSEISNLLRRHRSTLAVLVLREFLVDSNSWHQVFANLCGGALRDISVYHLGCGGYDPEFFYFVDEPYFIPMPETHPLLTLLFKDGPWVKEMDAILAGDDSEAEDSGAEVQEESKETEETEEDEDVSKNDKRSLLCLRQESISTMMNINNIACSCSPKTILP